VSKCRSGWKPPSRSPSCCRAALALAVATPSCRAGALHWGAGHGHSHPNFPTDHGDTGGWWWVGGWRWDRPDPGRGLKHSWGSTRTRHEGAKVPKGSRKPKEEQKAQFIDASAIPQGIQTIFRPRHPAPQRAVGSSQCSPHPHGAAQPCWRAIPAEPSSGSPSPGPAGISLAPLLIWNREAWIRALLARFPSWPAVLGSPSLWG